MPGFGDFDIDEQDFLPFALTISLEHCVESRPVAKKLRQQEQGLTIWATA
jgi:hypothetical protein